MMQDTRRPAMAPDRPRWSVAGDSGGRCDSEGSTVLRAAGPAREPRRSRSWGSGPGWAMPPSRGPMGGGDEPEETPPTPAGGSMSMPGSWRPALPAVVHEFTEAWERGEDPAAEDYLRRLDPADFQGAVDLIYREYCLAESDGRAPDPAAYVARFPRYAGDLHRLLRLHDACPPSMLGRLFGPAPGSERAGEAGPSLPEAGDSIGPYVLRRELGRGSFARVFLAEQADLENRLVVVKIATRSTREPWLLARARHAHIVEIVSHAVVDDAFQLICMPFWGGATLSDVLGAQAGASRRPAHRRGRGPATGGDLLTALDGVAAPEYPSVHPTRPAREILSRLSYDRAIAWVIARLAEALDHASSRDVTHGDVKPSNILLTADGNPMLLDFNLARDGAPAVDPSSRPVDPGGTLAYMAPERLRAVAGSVAASGSGSTSPGGAERPGAGAFELEGDGDAAGPYDSRSAGQAAHIADIYSLGMVLLESLCGRPPSEAVVPGTRGSASVSRPARLRSAASAYAAARGRPARAMVRDFEAATGRSVAPALRATLQRCLDPEPARRYRRAAELAEDLDRWRSDRPMAYADEPFWGQSVPRWLRVRRRALIAAAVSLLAVGLATTAMVLVGSNRLLHRDFETLALNKLARQWDDPESGAFLRSQRRPDPRAWEPDDQAEFEVARRALMDYEVLGPGDVPAAGDWRRGDGVRSLPRADGEDLEVWLMERAYRYCRALEDRPDATVACRQGMEILDRVGGSRSIRAFAPLRQRLAARLAAAEIPRGTAAQAVSDRGAAAQAVSRGLGQEARAAGIPGQDARTTGAPGQDARATNPTPAWLEEHLLGFVAESEPGSPPPDAPGLERRPVVEQALEHYERMLTLRPGSFWGHYRAAAACFGLGRTARAAEHLARCLERRPENAAIRMHLACCLIAMKRYPEALENCDLALERAPSYAEIYRTRAYARTASGQTAGLADDLRQFEMFSRILPRTFWGSAEAVDPLKTVGAASKATPGAMGIRALLPRRGGRDLAVETDADEVEARSALADALRQARLFPMAGAELEKILVLRPDHIPTRMMRAEQAIEGGRFDDARAELDVVLDHPGLEAYVRGSTRSLTPFFYITRLYLMAGKPDEARRVAERARDLATRLDHDAGQAHFNLARVYAMLGRSDPDLIEQAAKQLYRSFIVRLDFQQWYRDDARIIVPDAIVANWPPALQRWYRNDIRCFGPVRARIDEALALMEDPATVRRRLKVSKFRLATEHPGR